MFGVFARTGDYQCCMYVCLLGRLHTKLTSKLGNLG